MKSEMEIDLARIKRTAQEVAASLSKDLTIVGVLHSAGDGDYVELLINLEGCRREPCQLQIGVFRNASEMTLKQELNAKIRQHLDFHRAA